MKNVVTNIHVKERTNLSKMRSAIGPMMLGIGTILVSSMFAVLKSLDSIHPIIRASWRLQTTFLALAAPSALSIYLTAAHSNRKLSFLPPVATVWSGCGYALYNVGLCIALAKTSLLRASILSQCAPLCIVLYKIFRSRYCQSHQFKNGGGQGGVHWKHILGVVLTIVGTGVFISSTTKAHDNLDLGALKNKQSHHSALELHYRSHVIGDLAAAGASIGYATYISFGQQARRSVPVYIHLPGCVFVATILISIFYFMTVDFTVFGSSESLSDRENTIPGTDEKKHFGGETSDFCSNLLGWTCPQYLPRIAYLGIVCGAIAVGLINWSLNNVSALQAAAANSAEPIAASIIGIVFFSEPVPNFVAILAAGIIILAMLLCSADDGTNKKIENSDTVETDSEVIIRPDARKMISTIFFRGIIVFSLVFMEGFFIYYSQNHVPKVSEY
jgi:drug/metabolite transporter (DMT)-like permease